MSQGFFSRGFHGRRQENELSARIPPGQHLEHGFPVLSAGPTPHTSLVTWDFTIQGEVDQPLRWTWDDFRALPREAVTQDIHCVTKWSKLDTHWEGVSLDTLLSRVTTSARFVIAFCDGGYTTNLPLEDVLGGKAWVVDTYEGQPLDPQHGGPARLLVPHLYFWKSAKWVRGLRLVDQDEPGFWESLGYHNHGDPWNEERYQGD
ncbi:sulfite oxidase-like oxidoreductase [Ktedonobacter racemifer]|uniref:Oxidoreductase molybdopterin binding n=1 Tax=Ktedonobacter racemifer DSM 44963 TaxID=485913 RepID=D6TBC2_KTERA|nr:sulfite oxidase-like oxidoreductase [Ktedonobacter racemifer]EFH87906.1 oxidoreductase molybdopterin binding [Ktedonobacter racemifer DSM 44963]